MPQCALVIPGAFLEAGVLSGVVMASVANPLTALPAPPVPAGQVPVRPATLLPRPGHDRRGCHRTAARLDRNQRAAEGDGRPIWIGRRKLNRQIWHALVRAGDKTLIGWIRRAVAPRPASAPPGVSSSSSSQIHRLIDAPDRTIHRPGA